MTKLAKWHRVKEGNIQYERCIYVAEGFVSKKDRIIASAIEIISDSGLSALTTGNLAAKENMAEETLYKYFGSIDEVLIEVVEVYTRFDKSIQHTINSKEGTYIQKLKEYLDAYITYYDNYYAISTLMLQYEELLHNMYTRDKIAECIIDRINYMEDLFQKAIDNHEVTDKLSARELANNVTGVIMAYILSRRIVHHKKSFKSELSENIDKWIMLIKLD